MDGTSILQGDPVISISPNVIVKRAIFEMASEMIEPIIEKHGLEAYRSAAPVFHSGSMFTKVEQHIDETIKVAEWLLGREV